MASRTVQANIRFSGIKPLVNDLQLLNREFRKLNGAKATVVINVQERAPSSHSMLFDRAAVERSLTAGMRLSPSMLAPYINNGRILPDKMFQFIEGLNREIAKSDTKHRGSRGVIKNRQQFIKHHGLEFMYFRSKIGSPLNPVATELINNSLN